ncbi:MAG: hypothetical protein V4501_06220 [Pseudomonadota bacterium]
MLVWNSKHHYIDIQSNAEGTTLEKYVYCLEEAIKGGNFKELLSKSDDTKKLYDRVFKDTEINTIDPAELASFLKHVQLAKFATTAEIERAQVIKPDKTNSSVAFSEILIKVPTPRYTDPPELPFVFKRRNEIPPPFVPSKRPPPPIPAELLANMNFRKAPESQNWLNNKENYTIFVDAAKTGLHKSLSQQQAGKFRAFGEELFNVTNFYTNLVDSVSTLFQQAIIIHALLENKDKKYSELNSLVLSEISAALNEVHLDLINEQSLFQTLRVLTPVNVDTLLKVLDEATTSPDPFTLKDEIIKQLKELDPTPENLSVLSKGPAGK